MPPRDHSEHPTKLLVTGAKTARAHLILAHGAGAPMTSEFMEEIAALLAARGVCVTRFEFAYMAARRQGTRKPPPKAERLISEYVEVVTTVARTLKPDQPLFIGGKSMGGRVATLIADDQFRQHRLAGCVCLGYPFHPPKKPLELRTAHLRELVCPTLIVQGERDPFGPSSEVPGFGLSPAISLHWARDGDHDLAPRKSKGATHEDNLELAADAIASFCCQK